MLFIIILHKILEKYGNEGMCCRSDSHHLIYGPTPLNENLKIFHKFCKFVSIQIDIFHAQLKFQLSVPFQDTLTQLFFRLTQLMEKIIWYENIFTLYFVQGSYVKLDWFWYCQIKFITKWLVYKQIEINSVKNKCSFN